MTKLIIANWKLHPTTKAAAQKLATANDVEGVVFAPPLVYLDSLKQTLEKADLCAQDTSWETEGSITGGISPKQLKDIGTKYVLLGHSSRRQTLSETDTEINKKLLAALSAGLKAVLFVGEDLNIRKKGIGEAKKFITNQLRIDLKGTKKKDLKSVYITYEPIWAISTNDGGRADIPEESAEIAAYIKNLAPVAGVLYGGSVNSSNVTDFLSQPEIDGAVIGGASLKAKEFSKIIEAA